MTRWILDILRLLVFCSVFLLAATTLLADEEKRDNESRSFGLKIEIQDGEINVEQTGDTDLEELPAIIESKIAQIIEQVASDGKIQVRAKALLEEGSEALRELKDLPIGEMLDAIGEEVGGLTHDENVEFKVLLDSSDDHGDANTKRHAILVAGDGGGDEDIMKVIKGLKKKIGGDGDGEDADDSGDVGAVRVRVRSNGSRDGATHRLGVTISGPAGFAVADVAEDSAAEDAGIESGDIIVSVDGDRLEEVGDLIMKVSEVGQEGDNLKLLIVRDGEAMKVSVSPEAIEAGVADSDDEEERHEHDGPDADAQSHRKHRKTDGQRRERERDRARAEVERHHHRVHAEAVTHAKRAAERAMGEAKKHKERAIAMAKKEMERAVERESKAARQAVRSMTEGHKSALDELRQELAELRAAVKELRSEMAEDK